MNKSNYKSKKHKKSNKRKNRSKKSNKRRNRSKKYNRHRLSKTMVKKIYSKHKLLKNRKRTVYDREGFFNRSKKYILDHIYRIYRSIFKSKIKKLNKNPDFENFKKKYKNLSPKNITKQGIKDFRNKIDSLIRDIRDIENVKDEIKEAYITNLNVILKTVLDKYKIE